MNLQRWRTSTLVGYCGLKSDVAPCPKNAQRKLQQRALHGFCVQSRGEI
jgi:hypothetical protein